MKYLSVVVFLLISYLVQSQEVSSFENDDYLIYYPEGWTADDSGAMGTDVLFLSPLDGTEDSFQENFNIISQNLHGVEADLDSFTASSMSQIKNMIDNYEVVSNERKMKGDLNYQEVVYQGRIFDINMTFTQHYYVFDGHAAYVLTYTNSTDNPKFQNLAQLMFNNFLIKPFDEDHDHDHDHGHSH